MGWRAILDIVPGMDMEGDPDDPRGPGGIDGAAVQPAGPVRSRPAWATRPPANVRARFDPSALRSSLALAEPAAGVRPAGPPNGAEPSRGADAGDSPSELALSPFLECELGCVYCDANGARTREGRHLGDGGPAVLRREVARLGERERAGRTILLGSTADPYPPHERRARITRGLLEVLAGFDGVRLQVTTRSDLVLRDLDVLQEIGRRGHVRVNVTVTTLDRDLATVIEPRAPIPRKRLHALSRLVAAGVAAGVLATPLLPGITDRPRDLRALLCEAQAAGARWFGAGALLLQPSARAGFFGWLERARPDLVACYRRWYRSARASAGVNERIVRTVEALRRQYGVPESVPMPPARALPRQLSLFEPALDWGEAVPWTASLVAASAARRTGARVAGARAARPATGASVPSETGAA